MNYLSYNSLSRKMSSLIWINMDGNFSQIILSCTFQLSMKRRGIESSMKRTISNNLSNIMMTNIIKFIKVLNTALKYLKIKKLFISYVWTSAYKLSLTTVEINLWYLLELINNSINKFWHLEIWYQIKMPANF